MANELIQVLARYHLRAVHAVTALLAQRQVDVASMNVSMDPVTEVVRIHLDVLLDDDGCELLVKRLNRLVDVLQVRTVPRVAASLVRVAVTAERRSEVLDIARICAATVLAVDAEGVTLAHVRTVGSGLRLQELLRPFDVLEDVELGTAGLIGNRRPHHRPWALAPYGRLDVGTERTSA